MPDPAYPKWAKSRTSRTGDMGKVEIYSLLFRPQVDVQGAGSWEIGLKMSGLTPQSAAGAITESLRCAILTGVLPAGTQLKQSEIAKRFRASVVPVREAFQRIIAEGLAVHEPNRGVKVTSMIIEDVQEVTEVRALLEPYVLRLSALHLDTSDFSRAESILRQAATTSNLMERAQLHWDFHRALYARSARPRVLGQLGVLYTSIHRCLMPMWSQVGLEPRAIRYKLHAVESWMNWSAA